jgi:hypothetical protein
MVCVNIRSRNAQGLDIFRGRIYNNQAYERNISSASCLTEITNVLQLGM